MRLLILVSAMVLCAWAAEEEAPKMAVSFPLSSIRLDKEDARVTCGPCKEEDDNGHVKLTMGKCEDDSDNCDDFYEVDWQIGQTEAMIPVPNDLVRVHRIDQTYGITIKYQKDGNDCSDNARYKCTCGNSDYYGNLVIQGCGQDMD